MQIIYMTSPDLKTAKRIATSLLQKHLAACATFFPIGSMYWWQGRIKQAREVASFIKTADAKQAVREIRALHPYDTPCIITLDAKATEKYETWVRSCCKP